MVAPLIELKIDETEKCIMFAIIIFSDGKNSFVCFFYKLWKKFRNTRIILRRKGNDSSSRHSVRSNDAELYQEQKSFDEQR